SHDRVHSAESKPRRRSHCMLFCNSNIEESIWELLCEWNKACRPSHRSSDSHNIVALFRSSNEFFRKYCGPSRLALALGHARYWVTRAGRVHLILWLINGWGEAVPLLSDHMDNDWPVIITRITECVIQSFQIVAIDGADVFHSEFREHFRR